MHTRFYHYIFVEITLNLVSYLFLLIINILFFPKLWHIKRVCWFAVSRGQFVRSFRYTYCRFSCLSYIFNIYYDNLFMSKYQCHLDNMCNLAFNITIWEETNIYSTMSIAKIKRNPQSLFYDIPCNDTMDYEKWYTSSFWHNLKFKIMLITCRFHVSAVVLTLYISYCYV